MIIKLSDNSDSVFVITTNTVFGNQDTETCPEEFLTDYKVYGKEISPSDLEDHGIDVDEVIDSLTYEEIIEDDGEKVLIIEDLDEVFYAADSTTDYSSGDKHKESFMTLPENNCTFNDDEVFTECPKHAREKTEGELTLICKDCDEEIGLSLDEVKTLINEGIICGDCGRLIKID